MAISTTQKLAVYNGALLRLGSRKLSSLTEAKESRRVLDEFWGPKNDVVLEALELGDWNFATRTVRGDYSTSITPSFGFRRTYDVPSDFVRLVELSADEYFRKPLTTREYNAEAGYWFTDHEAIFARYVSNDDAYGLNAAAWSKTFSNFLSTDLAWKACERITNSTSKRDRLLRDRDFYLKRARGNDTLAEGPRQARHGNWVASRRGGYGYPGGERG